MIRLCLTILLYKDNGFSGLTISTVKEGYITFNILLTNLA